jgi:lysophospholipase L1-like esterase
VGKYGTLGSAFDRIFRNTLNKALDDVDTDINAQKKRVDDLIKGTPQPSEVVDARGGFPVLSGRLNDLSSSVAQKAAKVDVDTAIANMGSASPKGTYATLTALQTAFPTGTTGIYLVTADGKWYYWSGSAWTAGGTYQSTGIGDKAVTLEKLDDRANTLDYSYNLLDLTKVTDNTQIQSNGTPSALTGYFISDFIPVIPGEQIIITGTVYTGAYFKADKAPLFTGYNNASPMPLTIPANCYFIRATQHMSNKSTAMIYKGSTLGLPYRAYQDDFIKDDKIKTNAIKDKNVTLPKIDMDSLDGYFSTKGISLLKELKNPHKKTRIVLFGDSITHGLGATGFSATGTEFVTGVRQDVYTSNSWANKFRTYLNEHFNKMVFRSPLYDENVITTNGSSLDGSYYGSNNLLDRVFLSTTFQGETVKLLVKKRPNYGIFKVFVNGVFIQNVDLYNATEIIAEVTITGGNAGSTNTLELKETNTYNASSSFKYVEILAIGYNKTIELENYGISGAQSHAIIGTLKTLTTVNDDVIILMSGTNDRSYYDAWRTYSVLSDGIKWIKANRPSSKLIIMSANPCGKFEFDDTTNYKSHMEDIDMAIRQAALENSITFISHYKDMTRFLLDHGKPISYFSSDNVHPNDVGHQYMANNLIEKAGLAIKMNMI